MDHTGSTEHTILHIFHIINCILCFIALFPIGLATYLLFKTNFSKDRVSNVLILHILIPIFLYSVATIVLSIFWLTSEEVPLSTLACQILGFIFNLSIIAFPFSIAMRYTYYYWLIALERPIISKYWYSILLFFYVTAIVFLLPVAITDGFMPHSSILIITVPFTSKGPLELINTILYIVVMMIGGLAHIYFSMMIYMKFHHLLKSSSNPSQFNNDGLTNCPSIRIRDQENIRGQNIWGNKNIKRHASNSERQVLKKFLPVTIVYTITHIPFIALVLYENIYGLQVPIIPQCIYTFLYSLAAIVAPILAIKSNRRLSIGAMHLIDDCFRR